MSYTLSIQEFCERTEKTLNDHATLIGLLAGNLAVAYRALHQISPQVALECAEKFEAQIAHHGEYGWLHQILANAAAGLSED